MPEGPQTLTVLLLRRMLTTGEPAYVADAAVRGFGARVAGDRISFFVRYRAGGRQRRKTFGFWKEGHPKSLGLAEARDEARMLLTERTLPGAVTLERVAEDYMRNRDLAASTRREYRRQLRTIVLPALGHRQLDEISSAEVAMLVRDVSRRGPVLANRVLALIRRLYTWADGQGLTESNPAARVEPVKRERPRERVLDHEELAEAWHEAGDGSGGRALRFILLTGQRRRQVAGFHWRHFRGSWWHVPAEETKTGSEHRVWISPMARQAMGRRGFGYVFAGRGGSPMHLDAISRHASRVCSRLGHRRWTLHDLRRTVATEMARLGVPRHVRDLILHHAPSTRGVGDRVYNRYSYEAEMRQAWTAWADEVERITQSPRLARDAPAAES